MSKKYLHIFLSVFVGLIILTAILWLTEHWLNKHSKIINIDIDTLISSINSVDKISLGSLNNTIVLNKSSNQWQVNEFKASDVLVSKFKKQIAEIKISEITSKNINNYPRLGVDEKNSLTLSVDVKGKTLKFYIGKEGLLPGSFYMRPAKDINVYLILGPEIKTFLTYGVTDWRDKATVNTDKTKTDKVKTKKTKSNSKF